MSQLKKGAMLSYLTIILTNGIGLILTPFMISKLGDSEYGLYMLIGSLVGYISVLDFGLNNSIVRFVAKYRALEDRASEENFLATTMLIYFFISAIIIGLGVLLYFNLEYFFEKLTLVEIEKAKVMFVILIFNMAITLPGGAFSAICSGYERFVFPRVVNIIKYIVRSLMVVGLLVYGGDSISIVVLDTILNIVIIFIQMYYVLKRLNVVFKMHKFEFSLIKEILFYSVWIFVFAIVGQFQWQGGQVILGAISGTTAVAIYGVGIMLGSYYGAFSTAISSVFLPRATKMTFHNASESELTSMMVKIGRISFVVLLLIFGGFVLYGQQFIRLWVGTTYANSYLIAIIIMLGYTIPLVQSFANSLLEAKSKFSFKALVYISLIVAGTLFGKYLVKYMDEIGLVVGTTIGWLLSQVIMNFYFSKVLKLEIMRFFKELLAGLMPAFLIIVLLGYGIRFLPGEGWLNLLAKILIFFTFFAIIMAKIGLNRDELQMVKQTMNFINKK